MFYAQKAMEEGWGKRELRNQIARKAFERNEIAGIKLANYPAELQSTFKDAYLLDFLNLKNTYVEQDIERAILHELEAIARTLWIIGLCSCSR